MRNVGLIPELRILGLKVETLTRFDIRPFKGGILGLNIHEFRSGHFRSGYFA